tara:strand:- start:291 stop:3359 length:3069 start_codon:yes stop_codon:yes gene_type:complete
MDSINLGDAYLKKKLDLPNSIPESITSLKEKIIKLKFRLQNLKGEIQRKKQQNIQSSNSQKASQDAEKKLKKELKLLEKKINKEFVSIANQPIRVTRIKKTEKERTQKKFQTVFSKPFENRKFKTVFSKPSENLKLLAKAKRQKILELQNQTFEFFEIPERVELQKQLDTLTASYKKLWRAHWNSKKNRIRNLINQDKGLVHKLENRLNSFKKFLEDYKKYNSFLDNVFEYPLCESQKKAILIEEDRTLVIASAGSGKTSTLIGKYAFLVESRKAKEEEILILAFNKQVQLEIEKKLKSKGFDKPNVQTFHGFGKEILKISGVPNDVDPLLNHSKDIFLATQDLDKLIAIAKQEDSDYESKLLDFMATCPHHLYELFAKNEDEYNEAISKYPYIRNRFKINEEFRPMSIPCLDGKSWVKSQQEKFIANSLFKNGINFEYEAPLEVEINKKIRPDFYFPEISCWYEHYAVFDQGNSPYGPDYEKGHLIKEEFYQKNGIDYFSTDLSDYKSGAIEEKIYIELKSRGIVKAPRSNEEINSKIKEIYRDSVKTLLANAIGLYKESNLDQEEFFRKINSLEDQTRAQKFKKIFIPLFNAYKKNLHINETIDFTDMIKKATVILEKKDDENIFKKNKFKYLMVDEFQDVSRNRENLIKAILNLKENIKLFAVGDDWQSIYRFSGSDISLVTEFKYRFLPHKTKINIISETHRFPKEISGLASEFIKKNPYQISKDIVSKSTNGKISLCEIEKYSTEEIKKIVDQIEKSDALEKKGVFIIYRTNQTSKKIDLNILEAYRPDLEFKESTIHGVKGLENDVVIVLGLDGGMFGFPRIASEDQLISMFLPAHEDYMFAEERRVLYVALTRAKEHVFLVSAPGNDSVFYEEPSIFFKEIENLCNGLFTEENKTFQKLDFVVSTPCPKCKEKRINQKMRIKTTRQSKENLEKRVFPNVFMGCNGFTSNKESPTFCDYTTKSAFCPSCLARGNEETLSCRKEDSFEGIEYFVYCEKCLFKKDYFDYQKNQEISSE